MRRFPKTTLLILLLVAMPAAMAAECIVEGKVTDPKGEGITEVRVSVIDKSSGRKFKGETEKGGKYYIRGIPPADYEITYEKDGYTTHTWVGHLTAGKVEVIDVPLESSRGAKGSGGDAAAAAAAAAAAEELGKDFQLGVEKFNARDYDGAIASFQKVADKKPDMPDPFYNIGLCYQKKKDFAQAASWLQKAIDKKPDHAGAWFNLSFALFQQQKREEGLAAAQKAADADPTAETAYNCGALLKNVNQAEGAFAMFKKAVERDAAYADAHRELGYIYLAKNDAAGAKASLGKYLELQPSAPDAAEVKQILDQVK